MVNKLREDVFLAKVLDPSSASSWNPLVKQIGTLTYFSE